MVKKCIFVLVVFFFGGSLASCVRTVNVKYSLDNLEASGYYYNAKQKNKTDWKRGMSGEVSMSVSDAALTPALMAIKSGKVSEAMLEDIMDLVTLEAAGVTGGAFWSTSIRPSRKEFLHISVFGYVEPNAIKGIRFASIEITTAGMGMSSEKYTEIRALKQEGNKLFVFKEPVCTKDGKFVFNKDESCETTAPVFAKFESIRAYYQKDIDKMPFEPFEVSFQTKAGAIKKRQGR